MLSPLVEELSEILARQRKMLASAESCTGGMIAAALTDRAGSSDVFERGFVTYSNQAKVEILGVPENVLREHGAVSSETACAMAKGALDHSRADIAVSVTGIAGPGGATPTKPVGLVFIGIAAKDCEPSAHEHYFEGDRAAVRMQAVETALKHLIRALDTAQ